jgi:hypothetical protein
MLLKEFVCKSKNTSLRQAVHPLTDFHKDKTIYSLVEESIMLNDVLWEEGERHLHIFIPVKWHVKVHVLDVGAGKTCALCADHAVPKKFGGNHVSGTCGEFKGIIDQVTTNRDANGVRVLFLWTMIDDNSTIHDCPVSRDVLNLFGRKEEVCIGPIGNGWFSLCQLMYLFAHCQDPEIFEVVIMLQFLVLCYGYLGDGMDNATAVLLDVNDGLSPLQIGGNLNCLKSYDVMHCLDGDVARKLCVDNTDGATRSCGQLWRGTIAAFIVGLNDVIRGGSG